MSLGLWWGARSLGSGPETTLWLPVPENCWQQCEYHAEVDIMITHRQIAAFQEVMRNGSLTAAAEYLNISQHLALTRISFPSKSRLAIPTAA